MPRDLYTIKLPEDMTFLLDANDQPMAKLQSGRVFQLNHLPDQATLFRAFTDEMKRHPTRNELPGVTLQATAKVVEQTRTEDEFLDDLQEQETATPAILRGHTFPIWSWQFRVLLRLTALVGTV